MARPDVFDSLNALTGMQGEQAQSDFESAPLPYETPSMTQGRVQQGQQQRVQYGRMKAEDLASRGIPYDTSGRGNVSEITDDTGAPLTNADKSNKIAYDSAGKPVDYSQKDPSTGKRVLRDPYQFAPSQTDAQGNIYSAPKGLPWVQTGTDPAVQKQQQAKVNAQTNTALAPVETAAKTQLTAAAKAVKASAAAAKNAFQLQGYQFDTTQPPEVIRKQIEDKFAADAKSPQATDSNFWSRGTLTPEAESFNKELAAKKQAVLATLDQHQAVFDQARQAQAALDQVRGTRQQLSGDKLAAVNVKRAAAGLAPVGAPAAPLNAPVQQDAAGQEEAPSESVVAPAPASIADATPSTPQVSAPAAQTPTSSPSISDDELTQSLQSAAAKGWITQDQANGIINGRPQTGSGSPSNVLSPEAAKQVLDITQRNIDLGIGPNSLVGLTNRIDQSAIDNRLSQIHSQAEAATQEALGNIPSGNGPSPSPSSEQIPSGDGSGRQQPLSILDSPAGSGATEADYPLESLAPLTRARVSAARANDYKLGSFVDTAMDPSVRVLKTMGPEEAGNVARSLDPTGVLDSMSIQGVNRTAGVLQNVTADTVNFFTSPMGIATLGIGGLPKVAQKAIASVFALNAVHELPGYVRDVALAKTPEERDAAIKATIESAAVLGGTAGHILNRARAVAGASGEEGPPLERTFRDEPPQGPAAPAQLPPSPNEAPSSTEPTPEPPGLATPPAPADGPAPNVPNEPAQQVAPEVGQELAQRQQELAQMDPRDPMRPLVEARIQQLNEGQQASPPSQSVVPQQSESAAAISPATQEVAPVPAETQPPLPEPSGAQGPAGELESVTPPAAPPNSQGQIEAPPSEKTPAVAKGSSAEPIAEPEPAQPKTRQPFPDYSPGVARAVATAHDVEKQQAVAVIGNGKKYPIRPPMGGGGTAGSLLGDDVILEDNSHLSMAAIDAVETKSGKTLWKREKPEPAQAPTPKAPAKKPVASATKSTLKPHEVLNEAKNVKLTTPKGARFLRVTDAKGRQIVEPIENVTKGANVFQGAGPFKRVEAGVLNSAKKFMSVNGEITATDASKPAPEPSKESTPERTPKSQGGGQVASSSPEATKLSPEAQQVQKLANAALQSHKADLDALGHSGKFEIGTPSGNRSLEAYHGRIVIDPERLARDAKTAARISPIKNKKVAELEFIKKVIGEEVEHLKTIAFEKSDAGNPKRIEDLNENEPEIEKSLANTYDGWDKLSRRAKGHEIFRTILQARNDPDGVRPTTESTYKLISDFIAWLKKHVTNLKGDTLKLVKELEAMLAKRRAEKSASETKEQAPPKSGNGIPVRTVSADDLPTAKEVPSIKWYHGTGADITKDSVSSTFSNIESLMGSGVYLTDSPAVSNSYGRKRGGNKAKVYEISAEPRAVLNFDKPLPSDAVEAIKKATYEDLRPAIDEALKDNPNATGSEIWKALTEAVRDHSEDMGYSKDEYVEMYQGIESELREAGYDAIAHVGGLRTGDGTKQHKVLILLDPRNDYGPAGKELPQTVKSVSNVTGKDLPEPSSSEDKPATTSDIRTEIDKLKASGDPEGLVPGLERYLAKKEKPIAAAKPENDARKTYTGTTMIARLPRDMKEQLFNDHATFVNPEAKSSLFAAKRVPSGVMNIDGLQVQEIPKDQLKPYVEGLEKMPPIVIADDKLMDGQHRIQAAREKGIHELPFIDMTGLLNTEDQKGGSISTIPPLAAATPDSTEPTGGEEPEAKQPSGSQSDRLSTEGTSKEDIRFIPRSHPDAISKAAVKNKYTGEIVAALSHPQALQKALRDNQNPPPKDVDKWEDGFVTKKGTFLDRKQALAHAQKIKQITTSEYAFWIARDRQMGDDVGNADEELETTNLDRFANFMPDTDKPEDSEIQGERLMEEAEAAGLSPSLETIKNLIRGDGATVEKVRKMIRDRTGKDAINAATPEAFGASNPLKSMRDTYDSVADHLAARATKKEIAYKQDAVGNIANYHGQQAGDSIRLDLPDKLDREAMPFVIEAGGDPKKMQAMVQKIAASKDPKMAAKFDPIVDHAINNFARLNKARANHDAIMAKSLADLKANGIDVGEVENYVSRKLDAPEAQQDMMPNPLFGGAGGGGGNPKYFTKGRTFETLADAISAGFRPKSTDLADLDAHRIEAANKIIGQKKLFDQLKQTPSPTDGEPIIGQMEQVKKLNGKTEAQVPKGYSVVQAGGQPLVIHNDFKSIFQNLFGSSAIRTNAAGRALIKAAAVVKHGTLAVDTFHIGRMLFKMATAGGGGPLTVRNGHPAWNIHKGRALLEYTDADLGRAQAMGDITKKEADYARANRPKVEKLMEKGMNVGKVADNLMEQAKLHLPIVSKLNSWIFGKLSRSAMLQASLVNLDRNLKNPYYTEDQAYRQTAKEMNELFGNLQNQGILQNKTLQDISRLIFLAPNWTESQFRNEARAYAQAGKAPIDALRGRGFRLGNSAKVFAAGLVALLAANQVINYLTRGKSTFENKEKDHKLDSWIPGGKRGFWFSPLEIAGEYAHAAMKYLAQRENPVDVATHILNNKLSPMARGAKEALTGRDAQGKHFLTDADRFRGAVTDALPVPMFTQPFMERDPRSPTGFRATRTPAAGEKQFLQSVGMKVTAAQSPRSQMFAIAQPFRADRQQNDAAGEYQQLRQALDNADDKSAKGEIKWLYDRGKTFDQIRSAVGISKAGEIKPEKFAGNEERETEMLGKLKPDERAIYAQAQKEHAENALRLMRIIGSVPSPSGNAAAKMPRGVSPYQFH